MRLQPRRLVSALALGAAALGILATAASAHPPEGTLSIVDAEGAVLEEAGEGQELSLRGVFRHTEPDAPLVERIDLSLTAAEVDEACPIPVLAPVEGEEATREFLRPLPVLDCNGTWLLIGRARTGDASPVHGPEESTASTSFALAVRPADPAGLEAQVTEGATDGTVTLTWLANPEIDLVGYRVERLAPGEEDYEVVGTTAPDPEPTFVDEAVSDAGEHEYRVTAIRAGATSAEEDQVVSAGSDTATIDVTAATVTTTTTTIRGSATTVRRPGSTGSQPTPGAAGTTRPPTTRDTGFAGTLPFDPSRTTTSIVPGEQAAPVPPAPAPGDDAVVSIIEEDGPADGPGQLLAPAAASLALLVGAAHVRHVVRRAGEPEDVASYR